MALKTVTLTEQMSSTDVNSSLQTGYLYFPLCTQLKCSSRNPASANHVNVEKPNRKYLTGGVGLCVAKCTGEMI